MRSEEIDSLEKVQKAIETQKSNVINLVPSISQKLAVVLDQINTGLLFETPEVSIGQYVENIIELLDSGKYTSELEEQEFIQAFAGFREENAELISGMTEAEQDQLDNSINSVFSPLRVELDRLFKLKNLEISAKELERLEKSKQEEEEKLEEIVKKGDEVQENGMSYPMPDLFEFAVDTSTISRIAKARDCDIKQDKDKKLDRVTRAEAKERFNNVKEVLLKSLSEVKATIKTQDQLSFIKNQNIDQVMFYQEIRDKIEGRLAIPRTPKIDFTSTESVQKSSYLSLALMLNISADAQDGSRKEMEVIKSEIQKKLITAGIEENNSILLMESFRALIQMRLELNLTDPIDLNGLDEDKLDGHLLDLEERESWLREIVKKGVHEDPANQELLKDPEKKEAQLGKRAVEIKKGLWAQMDKDGSLHCLITDFNDENIAEVIKQLGSEDKIQWHRVPAAFKQKAEVETLRNWRRVFFDKGKKPKETALSKLMPETPGSWAKWLDNIDGGKHDWAHGSNNRLKSTLIRKVIGTNEQRLNEFWQDLANNSDHKGIADVYGYLTKEQTKIIEDSFGAQITRLEEKRDGLAIPSITDDSSCIEMNRCKIEISKLEKLAQTFGSTAGISPDYLVNEKKNDQESSTSLAL